MSVANEDAETGLPSKAASDAGHRLLELESRVEKLQKGNELLICFLFLTVLHVLAFYKLVPLSQKSAWPTWIALSGIGTVAVWFAWTQRPVSESITRVMIAFGLVALVIPDAVPYYMRFPTAIRPVPSGRFGLIAPATIAAGARADSFRSIVICWIVGAFVAAFLTTWFIGLQLRVPVSDYKRRPMSIRSILALTFCAALASYFIGSANSADRLLYFINGMTLGFVSSGIAWAVFRKKTWQRIVYPLVLVTAIISLDLGVGRLLNVWKGSVFDRFEYVTIFVGGLSVSPLLTFALLRQYGYEMTSTRISTAAKL